MGGIKIHPRIIISGCLLFFLSSAFCQPANQRVTNPDTLNRKRLNRLIIVSASSYTATMIGLSEIWYSNFDHQPFSFFDDSKEWLQVDKAGHFYSTFQLSRLASHSLQWTGMAKNKSQKIGALTSFAMMSTIEVFDGYSSGYGASASDLVANAFGASLYLGQHMLWDEIRIHPKFSFHTTYLSNQRPNVLGSNLSEKIFKDYNGQTYWLSVDMDKFVSFPKWLNLAIGYGAQDMIYASESANLSNGYNPYRQMYLSFDLDLSNIKTRSKVLKSLLYFANMIKLPSPTLEFSNGSFKTFAFYF